MPLIIGVIFFVLVVMVVKWLFANTLMSVGTSLAIGLALFFWFLSRKMPLSEVKNHPKIRYSIVACVTVAALAFGMGYTQKKQADRQIAKAEEERLAQVAAEEARPKCQNTWSLCKDNEELVNSYSKYHAAAVSCEQAANRQASWGKPDFPFISFGSFKMGNDAPKTGRIVLFEPNAKFQNGFGAMQRVEIRCVYDLQKEKVIDVGLS